MVAYVVNLLVGNSAIVLKDIVISGTCGGNELLDGRLRYSCQRTNFQLPLVCNTYQDLAQLIIGDVVKLSSMILRDHELAGQESGIPLWKAYEVKILYTHSMALAERTNVKESEGLIALEELEGRNLAYDASARVDLWRSVPTVLTLDDTAEDARHD